MYNMSQSYYNDTMNTETMSGRVARHSEYMNPLLQIQFDPLICPVVVDRDLRLDLPRTHKLAPRYLTRPTYNGAPSSPQLGHLIKISMIDRSPHWRIKCHESFGHGVLDFGRYEIVGVRSTLSVRCAVVDGQLIVPSVDCPDGQCPFENADEFVDYLFDVIVYGNARFPQIEDSMIRLTVEKVRMTDNRFGVAPLEMLGNYYGTSLSFMIPKFAKRPSVCLAGMTGGLTIESINKSHALATYSSKTDQIDHAVEWHLNKIRKDINNAVR